MKEQTKEEIIIEHYSKIGKKGGNTTKKYGKEYYSEMGKRGALKRWGNK